MHRNPARINRNARALEFDGLESLFLQELFESTAHLRTAFADYTQRALRRRFRYEPVEIRRVLRNEPDARRVPSHILRQLHNRLHQRHCTHRFPSSSAPHASRRTIPADHGIGMNLFTRSVRASLNLKGDAAPIRLKRVETLSKFQLRTGRASFVGKAANQLVALNNEVRILQRNRCEAAVRENFEP